MKGKEQLTLPKGRQQYHKPQLRKINIYLFTRKKKISVNISVVLTICVTSTGQTNEDLGDY